MAKRPSPQIVAFLGITAFVSMQSAGNYVAQVTESLNWQTISCEEKKAALQTLVEQETVDNLEWVYDGSLRDILDPACAFAGDVQGVGYVTDADLLLNPEAQEQLYYAPKLGIFFVSYLEKESVSYTFRMTEPVAPDEYLQMKSEALLQNVAKGRDVHSNTETTEPAPATQEPDASGAVVMAESGATSAEETVPSETGSADVNVSADSEGTESSSFESTQTEPVAENTTDGEGTQESSAPAESTAASSSSSARAFFREGKVTRTGVRETSVVETTAADEVEEPMAPVEQDPLMQQLLEEQQKILTETSQSSVESGDAGNVSAAEEVSQNTDTNQAAEAKRPSAPPKSGGMGIGTIITGVLAVLFGVGFTFFMLMRKKGKVSKDEIPPTATNPTGTPQQKSERLEKALAEMDTQESEQK